MVHGNQGARRNITLSLGADHPRLGSQMGNDLEILSSLNQKDKEGMMFGRKAGGQDQTTGRGDSTEVR